MATPSQQPIEPLSAAQHQSIEDAEPGERAAVLDSLLEQITSENSHPLALEDALVGLDHDGAQYEARDEVLACDAMLGLEDAIAGRVLSENEFDRLFGVTPPPRS